MLTGSAVVVMTFVFWAFVRMPSSGYLRFDKRLPQIRMPPLKPSNALCIIIVHGTKMSRLGFAASRHAERVLNNEYWLSGIYTNINSDVWNTLLNFKLSAYFWILIHICFCLFCVGNRLPGDITCLAVDKSFAFAACGKDVHAFSRGKQVNIWHFIFLCVLHGRYCN